MQPDVTTIWLKVWLCAFTLTHAFQYRELQVLGVSCPPMDTCRNRIGAENLYDEHSCSCASSCGNQENCCINSPYIDLTSKATTCSKIYNSEKSVLMVTRCGNRWRGGRDIKELCEGTSLLLGDPIEITPVTNSLSGVTYKNYFCAMCNNNDQSEVVLWDVQMSRVLYTRETMINNTLPVVLQYERGSNGWVYSQNETGGSHPVSLHISQPKGLPVDIPECPSDVVRTCVPDWSVVRVKRKCKSYTATIALSGRRFRNIHCAICNNVKNFGDAICTTYYERIPEITTTRPLRPPSYPPSLTVWLGHSLWNRRCIRENDIYIERLKGCRTIVCLKYKHVIKNGKCVSDY